MLQITQRPVPNKYWDDNTPKAYILHVDLGTYEGTYNHLCKIASASYHYYIRKTGEVVQFVPTYKGAWHAGKVYEPTEVAIDCLTSGSGEPLDPNRNSIGICYEGLGVDSDGKISYDPGSQVDGERPNTAQIEACRALIECLGTDKHILAHNEVTSYKPKAVSYLKDQVIKKLKKDYQPVLEEDKSEQINMMTQLVLLLQQLLAILKNK